MLGLDELARELERRSPSEPDRPRRLLVGSRAKDGTSEGFAFRDGESLRGGISRACHCAGTSNSWTVLQEVGLKHRNRVLISEDKGLDACALANALDVDANEIISRRYPDQGSGARDFFGITVPSGSIETRSRRFAPTFLARHGYHLAVWELRILPFCPLTWDLLETTCGICRPKNEKVQGWTRTLTNVDRCDDCGRPLSRREARKVPEDLRPALEVIATLLSTSPDQRKTVHRQLPAALASASPQYLLDVILGLARMMAAPQPEDHAQEDVLRLHRACRAVIAWPSGVEGIEFDASRHGQILPRLMQRYAALGSMTAAAAFSDLYSQNGGDCFEDAANACREIALGIREASAVARLEDDVLRAAWEHCMLPRRYRAHGPRLVPAFARNDLISFARAWTDRSSAAAVAYRFGIPTYGIEQCALAGAIAATPLSLPGAPAHFTSEAIASFLANLKDASTRMEDVPITLKEAMAAVSGGLKPWGTAIRAIIDRELPLLLVDGTDKEMSNRILVDRKAFEAMLGSLIARMPDPEKHPKSITQSDALEILNCSGSSLKILEDVASTGLNPKLFDLADVLDLARRVVATAEIAANLGLEPAEAYKLLQAARVPMVTSGGWAREPALRFSRRVHDLRARQLTLDL